VRQCRNSTSVPDRSGLQDLTGFHLVSKQAVVGLWYWRTITQPTVFFGKLNSRSYELEKFPYRKNAFSSNHLKRFETIFT
jgi:hypothetical protein